MAAEVLDPQSETVTPRERLWREFAARAATGSSGSPGSPGSPSAWRARTWLWATLMLPGGDDDAVVALLVREWAAYRAAHRDEPDVTFRPPANVPHEEEEAVAPGPPPYDTLPPLRHGHYGTDLPTHEERVREEQERLARRDQAFYGF